MIVTKQFSRIRMASLDSQYTIDFRNQLTEWWHRSTTLRNTTKIIKSIQEPFRCYTPLSMVVLLLHPEVSKPLQPMRHNGRWLRRRKTSRSSPRRGFWISTSCRHIKLEAKSAFAFGKNSANPFMECGLKKNPARFSKAVYRQTYAKSVVEEFTEEGGHCSGSTPPRGSYPCCPDTIALLSPRRIPPPALRLKPFPTRCKRSSTWHPTAIAPEEPSWEYNPWKSGQLIRSLPSSKRTTRLDGYSATRKRSRINRYHRLELME